MLWFAVKTRFDARIAYVFDVGVRPERQRQRQGHAFAAFLALEDEVRKLDLAGIALHVFGHNTAGQGLYARLGFRPKCISLFKRVEAPGVETVQGSPGPRHVPSPTAEGL